jgi:hypothetical protein
MEDYAQLRTELLENNLKKTALLQQMLHGADLIVKGGIEGIQEVAQTDPEIIIAAITSLTQLVKIQHEELVQYFEERLETLDRLTEIDHTLNGS